MIGLAIHELQRALVGPVNVGRPELFGPAPGPLSCKYSSRRDVDSPYILLFQHGHQSPHQGLLEAQIDHIRNQTEYLIPMGSSSRIALIVLVLSLTLPRLHAVAQTNSPKVGIGFEAVLQSEDGLGLGFRARLSKPLTWDLSLAVDLGISGFILEGQDDASYVIDPQLSLIVTFPNLERTTYLLGGFGVYAPFGPSDHSDGGPTIHLGVGRATPLRESTLYYEIDPAIIIQSEEIALSIPFRIGIIL